MLILPKLSYRYNEIPMIYQQAFFVGINSHILKLVWKGKVTNITEIILEKNNGIGKNHTTWF